PKMSDRVEARMGAEVQPPVVALPVPPRKQDRRRLMAAAAALVVAGGGGGAWVAAPALECAPRGPGGRDPPHRTSRGGGARQAGGRGGERGGGRGGRVGPAGARRSRGGGR